MLLLAVGVALAVGAAWVFRACREPSPPAPSTDAPVDAGLSWGRASTIIRVPIAADGAPVKEATTEFTSARELVVTSVAPDGRALGVHVLKPHEDVGVLSMDGATLRLLTDDEVPQRNPTVSPRGDRIAFYAKTSGRWTTWLVKPDGSEPVALELPSGAERVIEPVWSPDGTQLAGTALQDGIAVIVDVSDVGRATRQRTLRVRTRGQPFIRPTDWSRDGRRIVGFCEVDEVMVGLGVLDVATDVLHVLLSEGDATHITGPRFLLDGRHVVYVRPPHDVVVQDLDASLTATDAAVVYQAPGGNEVVRAVVAPDGALWVTTVEASSASD